MTGARAAAAAGVAGAVIGTINSPLYALSIAQLPGVQGFEAGGRDPFAHHAALGALRRGLAPLLTFGPPAQVAHLYGRLNAIAYLACAATLIALTLRLGRDPIAPRARAQVRAGTWMTALGLAITLFGNLLDYWMFFQSKSFLQEISFAITCQGLVILGVGGSVVGYALRGTAVGPRWAASLLCFLPVGGLCLYLSYIFVLGASTTSLAFAAPVHLVWLAWLVAGGAIARGCWRAAAT